MRETCNTSGVSRRTVLFAAAGAAPLLALTGGEAQAKIAQAAVHYQATPKDDKQCDGCNFFMAPTAARWSTATSRRPAGALCGSRRPLLDVELYGRRPLRRASASISTFISGFNSAETTTIVAAGRIAPKTSPCTPTTGSQ